VTRAETKRLPHGVYRVYWKPRVGGGMSLGAVGSFQDGSRWLVCTNWVRFPPDDSRDRKATAMMQAYWRDVSHVFLLKLDSSKDK